MLPVQTHLCKVWTLPRAVSQHLALLKSTHVKPMGWAFITNFVACYCSYNLRESQHLRFCRSFWFGIVMDCWWVMLSTALVTSLVHRRRINQSIRASFCSHSPSTLRAQNCLLRKLFLIRLYLLSSSQQLQMKDSSWTCQFQEKTALPVTFLVDSE